MKKAMGRVVGSATQSAVSIPLADRDGHSFPSIYQTVWLYGAVAHANPQSRTTRSAGAFKLRGEGAPSLGPDGWRRPLPVECRKTMHSTCLAGLRRTPDLPHVAISRSLRSQSFSLHAPIVVTTAQSAIWPTWPEPILGARLHTCRPGRSMIFRRVSTLGSTASRALGSVEGVGGRRNNAGRTRTGTRRVPVKDHRARRHCCGC